jgi:hypothetical protein
MKKILLAAVFVVTSTVSAFAQDADIRGVITEQFEAFKADDFAKAFTFASPALQSFFMTSENFGRMVTQGYPMVWRPADVTFLEPREEEGTFWQKVEIQDEKGKLHYLEYRMQRTQAGWRISGVQILDGAGASV